jgi:hypothetical protein
VVVVGAVLVAVAVLVTVTTLPEVADRVPAAVVGAVAELDPPQAARTSDARTARATTKIRIR